MGPGASFDAVAKVKKIPVSAGNLTSVEQPSHYID